MTVVFCIPGKEFSDRFLTCWTELLVSCIQKGITPYLRNTYTSNVYLCRNVLLREGVLGEGIKVSDNQPLNGLAYDYLMWIDSDMVFTPEHVYRLIKYDRDIVSGSAMIDPKKKKLNWGRIDDVGHCRFILKDDVPKYPRDEQGLAEVDFVGFAFMLVKRGVFESIPYPWFRPVTQKIGGNVFFPSEDIGWCHTVREAGFKVWVDPDVHIGHEKPMVMIG